MRVVFEPRFPKSIDGISTSPKPNWNDEEEEEDHSQICTARKRFAAFAYDELYLSDESDDEFDYEPEYMMNKVINDY
ncbi:mRNA export factor GLE1 [Cardamine amara subsp. amara]|uniref:mRNA export factor GLE1 n=1 Tax=Cardamine amara subsp. amara TaxID=228776 RepID=A0ABD1BG92_CARAN